MAPISSVFLPTQDFAPTERSSPGFWEPAGDQDKLCAAVHRANPSFSENKQEQGGPLKSKPSPSAVSRLQASYLSWQLLYFSHGNRGSGERCFGAPNSIQVSLSLPTREFCLQNNIEPKKEAPQKIALVMVYWGVILRTMLAPLSWESAHVGWMLRASLVLRIKLARGVPPLDAAN